MPFAPFFREHGIFVVDDFLELEVCRSIIREMDLSDSVDGTVWRPGDGEHKREEVKRRKEMVGVPEATNAMVSERLVRLAPAISEYLDIEVSALQPIKFTRYDTGDYYRMHRDVMPGVDTSMPLVGDRKVSVIVFLGQEGDTPDEADYCGGNLTFYGLLGQGPLQGLGLPLESEKGMLVAFKPDIFHEVTPVTSGTRHTITTWFM